MTFPRSSAEKEFVLRVSDLLFVLREYMDRQDTIPLDMVLTYNKTVDCLRSLGHTQEQHYGDEYFAKKH